MSLGFVVYLIGILNNLKNALDAVSIAGLIVAVLGLLFAPMTLDIMKDFDISRQYVLRLVKRLFCGWAVIALLAFIIPSGKTVAAMYLLPAVAENQNIQEIAGNSVETLKFLTRQWLDNLAKERK